MIISMPINTIPSRPTRPDALNIELWPLHQTEALVQLKLGQIFSVIGQACNYQLFGHLHHNIITKIEKYNGGLQIGETGLAVLSILETIHMSSQFIISYCSKNCHFIPLSSLKIVIGPPITYTKNEYKINRNQPYY